ncbi:putative quinol monooxygenase [Pseudonocardia adelaidensis]|uniref:Antibiotic biosynthesis monooxygenase n=1 Tax=Pseudonocardia adelaidensis TaxID=648754 RepID=A0ABP9NQ97_9PSEU
MSHAPVVTPVVVTAVFRPLPGRREDARAAIEGALPGVHAEEGCLLYALHDAADGTLVLLEKWESQELLDAHSAGEAVERLGRAIDGLLAEPPAVVTMTALPAGDPDKGRL